MDNDYPDVTPRGVPRTREFLSHRIDTLKSEMDDIKAKLDLAKRTARSQGGYCDPEWLTSLEAAKRRRGTAIQSLQRELSIARKRENEAEARIFERCFMRAARLLLDQESYSRLMAKANELKDASAAEKV